jgi:pimeloyl-ACP methyl ester carboxylesterase
LLPFALGAAINILFTTGCAPPTPKDVLEQLSLSILAPGVSCEELRAAFDVEHLPVVNYPDEVGLPFEEHFLPTNGNQQLRLWYIPAVEDRGTVIVSPGSTGAMPCYLFVARLLHTSGWSTVIYDYEGFGGSSGSPTLNALLPNLETAIQWTSANTPHQEVTLLGMSLGSIPSVAAAVTHPETINGVILDSPVALGAELSRFERYFFPGWADRVRSLIDPSLISEDVIPQLSQPLLIYLHELDVITPAWSIELLFDRAPGPKEMVRFGDLTHSAAQFERTEQYVQHLNRFLENLWEAPDATATRAYPTP